MPPVNRNPNFTLFAFLVLFALSISACSSIAINDSAFPYIFSPEKIAALKIKKIVVVDKNFGTVSKNYLSKHEKKIDDVVRSKLMSGNYEIVSDDQFNLEWQLAVRKYGNPYNTNTNQLNSIAFKRVIHFVFSELEKTSNVDAILFTDLVEQEVVFSGKNKRQATWHGVSRKPIFKGAAANLSADFNWAQPIPAISLRIVIYSTNGSLLFKSLGGLDVTRQVDVRKNGGKFVRRTKLLNKQTNIEQGVNVALHPFILYER